MENTLGTPTPVSINDEGSFQKGEKDKVEYEEEYRGLRLKTDDEEEATTLVFARRYFETTNYDQELIDYLKELGYNVIVIEEDEIMSFDYEANNTSTLIVGAPDDDYTQLPEGDEINNLEVDIISLCRYTSRDLDMATGSASDNVGYFTVEDPDHPIIKEMGLSSSDTLDMGEEVSSHRISSLTDDTNIIMGREGFSSGSRAGLAERLEGDYYRFHFGYHRFDVASEGAFDLFGEVLMYIGKLAKFFYGQGSWEYSTTLDYSGELTLYHQKEIEENTDLTLEYAITDGSEPTEEDWQEATPESYFAGTISEGDKLFLKAVFESEGDRSPVLHRAFSVIKTEDSVAQIKILTTDGDIIGFTDEQGELKVNMFNEPIEYKIEVEDFDEVGYVEEPYKDILLPLVPSHDRTVELEIPSKRTHLTEFDYDPSYVNKYFEPDNEYLGLDREEYWMMQKIEPWLKSLVFEYEELDGETVIKYDGSTRRHAFLWYDVGAFIDATVTMKIKSGDDDDSKRPGLILRASGTDGNGYLFRCWILEDEFQFAKVVDGNFFTIEYKDFTFDDKDAWYNVKAQVEGNNLRVKIWKEGETEPEDWTFEITDTDLEDSPGYCGFQDYGSHISYFKDLHVEGTPVSIEQFGWDHIWTHIASTTVPQIIDEPGATKDKALRIFNAEGDNDRRCIAWLDIGAADEVEILTRIKCNQSNTSSRTYFIGAQILGASGASGDNEFGWHVRNGGDDTDTGFQFIERFRGDVDSLDSVDFPWEEGEWFYLRAKFNRFTKKLKLSAWKDGEVEPEDWMLETEGEELTARGFIGITPYSADNNDIIYDFFSVGMNGASAPMPEEVNN